jgi:hypothetical protein
MRRALDSLALVVLCATSAYAQQATDYVVQPYAVGSKYEAPPAGATTTTITGDDNTGVVSLPFTFTFFGTPYTSCNVCTNGFLSFTSTATTYSNVALPAVSTNGAALCPYWNDLVVGPVSGVNPNATGTIQTWSSGTGPSQHFTISWEQVWSYDPYVANASGVGPFTFQIQLYATSGSIVYAYNSPTNAVWPTSGATIGIQAADGRYQFPSAVTNDAGNNGQPPNDFSLDLPKVVFTGRVLYDRYVVDESGIGNTSEQNIPLTGFRVEARNDANVTVGIGTTDSNGAFSVEADGVPPATIGSLVVCSQNAVCSVRATSGGALYATTLNSALPFATDRMLGDLSLHEGVDPGGVGREPLNIARTVQTVYDWAHARSSDSIPVLEILYSKTSALPTSYTAKVGATPASMRVSGAASNPDAWDVSVIRKTYGRHVLGAISADPTTTYTSAFDAVSNPTNAFAEGFGYYMNAVVSGDRKYYDGINSTTTNVIDLEDANPQSRKGDDVAAWVAEALYDLTDPADEPWDTYAGAGAAGAKAFQIVDSLTAPPTATTFFNAWLAAGFDGPALSQNFIHHGLIADDDDEPNDDATTATALTDFGFLRDGRVLNLFNEDWYSFTLAEPTASLTASVFFDRSRYASAQVALELRSAANSVLATGVAADAAAPFALTSASLPAGKYFLRVALASGGPIPAYSVQAFPQLKFKAATFQPWTVGRPYDVPLSITGGIAPYILTVPTNYEAPAGLVLDGADGRATGTPAGPAAGVPQFGSYRYDFLVKAQDSARPPNQAQRLMSFTLNDIVRSRFAEFVAFAKGKAVDRPWPPVGGTPPYTVSVDEGSIPHGVDAVGGADLRFTGSPDAPGSTAFRITATDVAGSSATTLATAVVCVPPGPADLAAGKSACGYYVDVVKGSTFGFAVATAKKRPVRALRTALYDVDGIHTLPVAPKIAKGKISLSKFVAPASGRFYFVIASDDDLDATQFACVAKTSAPTAAKGDAGTTAFGGDLAGGTLTLTVKPDKKSGLRVSVVALKDPTGAPVALAATDVKVVAKTGVLTLTKKVDSSGTWTVVLGAQTGPRGAFTYAFKLKQMKGVVYSAD